jgi:hypothetical protein
LRVAYIISAYRYPEQLVRLVDRLDAGNASFFVHVDRKSPDAVFQAMLGGLANRPNVVFLPRHRADWGGFGHVEATLKGIRAAFRSGEHFDRAVLLTGQDYPIKSNRHIAEFFAATGDREFMEFFPLPHAEWQNQGMDRIENWHWHVSGRHVVIQPSRLAPIRRRLPDGLRPFGGSSYWCLTRDCLGYIHEYVMANPSVVRFFRHTDVPDELFFQTIVMNSAFAERTVNDNLRFILWDDPDPGSPKVLGMEHLAQLSTSPALFARKFDATVEPAILDAIDRTLLVEHQPREAVG